MKILEFEHKGYVYTLINSDVTNHFIIFSEVADIYLVFETKEDAMFMVEAIKKTIY